MLDINTLPNQTEADRATILASINGIIWHVIGQGTDSLDADSLDDLHASAIEAANRAIIDHDPSRPAELRGTLATLIVRYVTQARRDFMRRRGAGDGATHNKQSTFEHSTSRLDDCCGVEVDGGEADADRTHEALSIMEITIDMARNDDIIDEREYTVLTMRRQGFLQREIAERMEICAQRVHQIQGDAIRKIRKQYRTAE